MNATTNRRREPNSENEMSECNTIVGGYTAAEVIRLYAERNPGSDPVAAEFDNMAAFADGYAWFVFCGSEESAPVRIVMPYRD